MSVWRARSLPWVALLLLPLLVPAGRAVWSRAQEVSSTLSRAQAVKDIEDFRRRLLAVHPDPHRRVSAAALDAHFERAVQSLPPRVHPDHLFEVLAGIAARLGDSHTSVAPPRPASELLLPVHVNGRTVVLTTELGPLPPGSRVSHLDEQPVGALLASIRALASAESDAAIDVVLPAFIPFAHRRRGARPDRVVLDAVTPNGTTLRATVTRAEIDDAQHPAVESGVFPNGTVYLHLRTMAGEVGEYGRYFRDFFAGLEKSDATGLIVDLRDNDGGNTLVGQMLLSYLTRRPYRIFAEKRWRVSRHMQDRVRGMGAWSERYLAAAPGGYLVEVPPLESPPEVKHSFRGPSVLLIGPRTRSAAMMTANAARDFDLLPVLGSPTTSPPNFFGESYRYNLPHSGLRASISSAEFIRANGDANDPGTVLPHLEVADADGIASVQDEVVAVGIALIERHAELAGQAAGRGNADASDAAPARGAELTEVDPNAPLANRLDFR